MAVAAGEAQATVNTRIPLAHGRALYLGTLAFGNKYATGGDTLGTLEASRYKLPEKLDMVKVGMASGYAVEFVKPSKLKLYFSPAAKELPAAEVANGTDVSAVTATPFEAIGLI